MKTMPIAAAVFLGFAAQTFAQTATVVTVPGEVRTYVTQQEVPSVVYDGDIAVGSELPASVEVHTVPSNDAYTYTVINKQRLIIDPHTRRVIEVVR